MNGVLVITGPTATGKTALAVMLAQQLGGEVVGADSMQIYRGMVIGAAAPTDEEMCGVPHHLVGTVDPGEDYSAARYVEDAARCVDDVLARGRLPIITGGTGLYIDSLLSGRYFMPSDAEIRARLERDYDSQGSGGLMERLRRADPAAAERISPNDKKRLVRALEVYYASGRTMSEHIERTRSLPPRYRYCKIALNYAERADLYSRINQRVDEMFRCGFENEVRRLLAAGVPEKSTAMQAIGYRETAAVIRGETDIEQAKESIKQASRRYAKRQLSWLSSRGDVNWIIWDKKRDYSRACAVSTLFMEKTGIM